VPRAAVQAPTLRRVHWGDGAAKTACFRPRTSIRIFSFLFFSCSTPPSGPSSARMSWTAGKLPGRTATVPVGWCQRLTAGRASKSTNTAPPPNLSSVRAGGSHRGTALSPELLSWRWCARAAHQEREGRRGSTRLDGRIMARCAGHAAALNEVADACACTGVWTLLLPPWASRPHTPASPVVSTRLSLHAYIGLI